jgi:hypothetical protein
MCRLAGRHMLNVGPAPQAVNSMQYAVSAGPAATRSVNICLAFVVMPCFAAPVTAFMLCQCFFMTDSPPTHL